jgi:hypothetical protein
VDTNVLAVSGLWHHMACWVDTDVLSLGYDIIQPARWIQMYWLCLGCDIWPAWWICILKGRQRLRWEDDVRNDLRKMGVKNWKQRVQERKHWKEIIEQAKTHKKL